MIYADNAATTRLSDNALRAMQPFFQEIYGNPSSLYSFGQKAKECLVDARKRIARCLGAEESEISTTCSLRNISTLEYSMMAIG